MAYFLKRTRNKKGLYLQIYESHWDPECRHTANRSVKALGYVDALREKGIEDPEAHFSVMLSNCQVVLSMRLWAMMS